MKRAKSISLKELVRSLTSLFKGQDNSRRPDLYLPPVSPIGIDPYCDASLPLRPITGYYLSHYLNSLLPQLHPFSVQQSLFRRRLTSHLASSPLLLASTLAVASLRLDNYSNRITELSSFYQTRNHYVLSDDIPHSFRFKAHTTQLLREALDRPDWQTPPYDILVALINLASYASLVSCHAEARMHLHGLHAILQKWPQTPTDQDLSITESAAFDTMLGSSRNNCVLWPKSLELQRVKGMISWQSALPPIIGIGLAGKGKDFGQGELEFLDAARSVGVGYCFLGLGEGSELLKRLIAQPPKVDIERILQSFGGIRASGQNTCSARPDGFKPTCRRIGCDGQRFGSWSKASHAVMIQAIEALLLQESWVVDSWRG